MSRFMALLLVGLLFVPLGCAQAATAAMDVAVGVAKEALKDPPSGSMSAAEKEQAERERQARAKKAADKERAERRAAEEKLQEVEASKERRTYYPSF